MMDTSALAPIELLSPAGDFSTALAAFAAGADAVYLGLSEFSARAYAQNFSFEELGKLLRYAHADNRGKKVYVAVNTLVEEAEMEAVKALLARLAELAPDAVIVQDLGVARICREYFPSLTMHASTQLVAHDLEGVLALRELGFARVVLSRELTLAEISSIASRSGVEIEVFIHGALCYSISGLCLFSAMERGRSGNRGCCAYCCRGEFKGAQGRPFSMKDLRLGGEVAHLQRAGVASLKIEGRMKTALYVAAVTRYYRDLLDGRKSTVTTADLETVFSRRTTPLYFNGHREDVVDGGNLGHLGAEIGQVKRVTRDREGRAWLRFHTARALEKHDGLQFDAVGADGRRFGFGIGEMRKAISRATAFQVSAGEDVEVELPATEVKLRSGDAIYCSMSNAVKRAFPAVSYREGEDLGTIALDLKVVISSQGVCVFTPLLREAVEVKCSLEAAKKPECTFAAVEKAFSRLGGTDYRLGRLILEDTERRFVPPTVLNDVRRELVERLNDRRSARSREALERALFDNPSPPAALQWQGPVVKLRLDQPLPPGDWAEVVRAITIDANPEEFDLPLTNRLSTPIFVSETAAHRLRRTIKRFLRAGFVRWEATDLSSLRMLKSLGVVDLTADWSLYANNASALSALSDLGVKRFVASPETSKENRQYLAESGFAVECLAQQSTPLFISMHRPASEQLDDYRIYQRDGLYVTVAAVPRRFEAPDSAPLRFDLSWEPLEHV